VLNDVSPKRVVSLHDSASNGYAQEEELLSTFEKSLAIFETDLANVVSKQADGAQAPPPTALAVQTRGF
jgi:hypothetical protein